MKLPTIFPASLRVHSLRLRLLLMMLLAALPAFAVIAWLAHAQREAGEQHYRESTLVLAQTLANEHAQNFEQAALLLSTLAHSLQLHETAVCQPLLAAMQAQAPRHIANLFVTTAAGQVRCSARDPEKLTQVADMRWFRTALATPGGRVGEYHLSRRTGQPTIVLTHTLHRERPSGKQAVFVLAAALDLSWLARQPLLQALPPGAAYGVFDARGNQLLHYPPAAPGTPRNIADTGLWHTLTAPGAPSTFVAADLKGIVRLFAHVPLGPAQQPYAHLLVGVPEVLAYREAHRTLAFGLLALAAAMTLGLAIGWLGGWGLLLRPLRPVFDTVQRVAAGDFAARTGVPPGQDEISRLAAAVDVMAEAVQVREHDLHASRNRLNSLMENMPGTAFRCEAAYPWAVQHISQSVQQLTGWPASAFMQGEVRYGELIHADDLPRVHQAVAKGIADRQVYACEYRVRHADGSGHWAYEQGRAVYDAQGQARWLDGVILDISDRKHLEEETTRLQSYLQQAQKMEALGQLTGGIAHDFNNILASVLGFAKLALRRHAPDKQGELADFLREIITAGERARDLVMKMLAFGRSQPGRTPASLSPLPLAKEVVKMLSSTIPASIRIHTDFEASLPDITMDAVAFHQILVNLVINARDAIGEKGTIDLGLHTAHPEHLECTACHAVFSGEFIELSVRDTGTGIAPEALPRIFEPFFTTKEVGQGSGMGLAMVHGLVNRAGGHFRVISTPGQGTAFHVFLPLAKTGAATPPASATPMPPAGLQNGEVLLVDDEPAILRMLSATLNEAGWQTSSFDHPHQALAAFARSPARFQAVVTDQSMPDMTGQELARALLKLRPDLPVVLCSGHQENPQAEPCIRERFIKPVEPDMLLATLARLTRPPG